MKLQTMKLQAIRQMILTLAVMALSVLSVEAKGDYYVVDFGAKADGTSLDHHAINAAIDSCTANGGGRVVLTPGRYLCGSIRMKANVELHIMAGATIIASANKRDYDESEV